MHTSSSEILYPNSAQTNKHFHSDLKLQQHYIHRPVLLTFIILMSNGKEIQRREEDYWKGTTELLVVINLPSITLSLNFPDFASESSVHVRPGDNVSKVRTTLDPR